MNHLVVGADGLIGSALLAELRSRGLAAVGTSRRQGSGHLPLDLVEPGRFTAPRGGGIAFLCAGCGGIAECAADPVRTSAVQVEGLARLAGTLSAAGFRVVLVSSSLVFDGMRSMPGPDDPPTPACEYGRQKATLESLMPEGSAIVRVTKIAESLEPRLRGWRESLRNHGTIRAASRLRLAPVALADLTGQLAFLAGSFKPGVFQLSAADDLSYFELAGMLAGSLGFAASSVTDDPVDVDRWFERIGSHATLAARPPQPGWTSPPSALILRALIASRIAP